MELIAGALLALFLGGILLALVGLRAALSDLEERVRALERRAEGHLPHCPCADTYVCCDDEEDHEDYSWR